MMEKSKINNIGQDDNFWSEWCEKLTPRIETRS